MYKIFITTDLFQHLTFISGKDVYIDPRRNIN